MLKILISLIECGYSYDEAYDKAMVIIINFVKDLKQSI